MEWLGVHPTDISVLCLNTIPMTHHDQKKTTSLIERAYINEDIKQELRILQRLDKKCEIESLNVLAKNFLVDQYIPRKVDLILKNRKSN